MTARVNTIFSWCNDVARMRHFYSEVLGLHETYFDAGPGWLTYDCSGVQLVFIRGSKPVPQVEGWARQPSWREGTAEVASLVLQLPLHAFQTAIARAQHAGSSVELHPTGVSGTSSTTLQAFLRDPMGTTIEIYCEAGKEQQQSQQQQQQ